MIAGEIYDPSDPELVSEARRALRLADEYQRIYLMDNHAARHVLVDLVGQLGEDVEIKPPLFVDYGTQLSIGERTFINYNLTALDVAPISIGADCLIGPNVQLLTPPIRWSRVRAAPSSRRPGPSRSVTMCGSAAAQPYCPVSASGTTASSAPARWSPGTFRPTWWRWAIPPASSRTSRAPVSTRRVDPDRRESIIDCALELIAARAWPAPRTARSRRSPRCPLAR